jgi:hypothetical protein
VCGVVVYPILELLCVWCGSVSYPRAAVFLLCYVLFLIPVFIVQVKMLVQFNYYNAFSEIPPSTSMHSATRVRTWRVARLYSVQCTVQ